MLRAKRSTQAHAAMAYLIASVSRPAVTLTALPLLLAYMSTAEFALFAIVTPVPWLAQSLLTMGVNDSIVRNAALKLATTPVLVGGHVLALALSCFSALLLAPVGSLVGIAVGQYFFLSLIGYSLGQASIALTSGLFRGQQRAGQASAVIALSGTLPVVAGSVAIVAISATATCYYAAAGLASLTVAVWALSRCEWEGNIHSFVHVLNCTVQSIQVGLPLVPQVGAALALDFAVRMAIAKTSDNATLVVASLAMTFGSLGLTVLKAWFSAWSPRLITQQESQLGAEVRRWSAYTLAGLTAGYCILMVVSVSLELWNPIPSKDLQGLSVAVAIAGLAAPLSYPQLLIMQLALRRGRTASLAWILPISAVAAFAICWIAAGSLFVELLIASAALMQILAAALSIQTLKFKGPEHALHSWLSSLALGASGVLLAWVLTATAPAWALAVCVIQWIVTLGFVVSTAYRSQSRDESGCPGSS